jgi:CBS domain-containing protein
MVLLNISVAPALLSKLIPTLTVLVSPSVLHTGVSWVALPSQSVDHTQEVSEHMKVRDAMAKTIQTATPQDNVAKVAKLMKQEDAGFIPITEGDRLAGVVTDRDLVVRCLAEGHRDILEETVEHVMTRDPMTISADDDIEKAAELMGRAEVRRLPVVEGDRLVGVLSHGNLVQATGAKGPGGKATEGVTKGA